jgi:hypothetical protein
MTDVAPHFTFHELVRTGTGLKNVPSEVHLWRARILAVAVLGPWRRLVGPLEVTSWFRCPRVNREVGGADESQHLRGEAVDVIPVGLTGQRSPADRDRAWAILLELAKTGLPVDQAVIYENKPHIHVSCTHEREPRRQFLVDVGGKRTIGWAAYTGPLKGAR